jgi:hypothetical protein
MEDFPIWLKLLIWLAIGGTVVYAVAVAVYGYMTGGSRIIQGRRFGTRLNRVVVAEQFSDLFPSNEFDSYDAFVSTGGECLKSEPRTLVVRFERRRPETKEEQRFIIKEYYYPAVPRTRMWLRHSKAEHEFRSLLEVAELGISAAQPVAFGDRRTVFGCVRACFLVTCYVENAVTLEQWADEARQLGSPAESTWPVCQALGKTFRTLHVARFFLFTAKPRNILVRRTGASLETILIDVPYALRVRGKYFARYVQAFDLAVFLGNVAGLLPQHQISTFYKGYFPDPLGGAPEELQSRIAEAIRWRMNQTPVSRVVHHLRRSVKGAGRRLSGKLKSHRRKEDQMIVR